MSGTDSLFVSLSAVAIVVAAVIGITRSGFAQAESAINATNSTYGNSTAAGLESLSGQLVELLPLLVLALGAVVVLRTVQ